MASAHRRHYAGEVTYHTRGWLDKSRGSLRPNLVRLMQTSECPLLYALPWEVLGELEGGGGSDSVGGGVRLAATTRRTVGMQFAAELRELVTLLGTMRPHVGRLRTPYALFGDPRHPLPWTIRRLGPLLRSLGACGGLRSSPQLLPKDVLHSTFQYQALPALPQAEHAQAARRLRRRRCAPPAAVHAVGWRTQRPRAPDSPPSAPVVSEA